MKKFLLALVLAIAVLPVTSLADRDWERKHKKHRIYATEMSSIGAAAATLVGALAYLAIRKRAGRRSS